MIALFFLLILFSMRLLEWMPYVLTLFYFTISACTFFIYGLDKILALKKRQRISENKLHIFSLLGGWPGAYIGQQIFWHKVSKPIFLRKFYAMAIINVVVLSSFLTIKYQQVFSL